MSKKYIASLSGGKDSTAMLLKIIELGLPLDDIIFIDTGKEYPEMYRHIQARFSNTPDCRYGLKVRSEEIVFQSSNAWDASGASAFGFKVAWVNRFGQSKERLPGQPDVEIQNLIELPTLLK